MSEDGANENAEYSSGESGSLLDSINANNEANSPSFLWDDGVAGSGEKPEYFRSDKYKTVAEQAKGYSELEKRFGGFTGAPKDGYQLPEDFDKDDAFIQELNSLGTEYNINQELYGKLLEFGAKIMDASDATTIEKELNLLGDKAQERISNVDNILRNNLGEKYEQYRDAISTAKVVELVEDLVSSFARQSQVPTGNAVAFGVPTQADIDEMMNKKGDNGETLYYSSESYRKKVQDAIARMHGEKEFRYVSNQ